MKGKATIQRLVPLAAAIMLIMLACVCSLGGLSSPEQDDVTLDSEFFDTALEQAYEDPFDPDLLVTHDDDGDGLPEGTYPLTVGEEVAPGVYLDRVLHLDPNDGDIDATLELVLENTTDEAVDVVIGEEIPKAVLEHVEPGDIQVEPPVEVVILDADPRYEIRVLGFAAGYRATIATNWWDRYGSRVINELMDNPTPEQARQFVENLMADNLLDFMEQTAHFTVREWVFLRRSAECALKSGREAAVCNWLLLTEFPDRFTTDVCQEEALIANEVVVYSTDPEIVRVKQEEVCEWIIERNPDACLSYGSFDSQQHCFELIHGINNRGCEMLMRLDHDAAISMLGCLDEADTSHADFCRQNYSGQERDDCCSTVPDYLQSLCEDTQPVDSAAAGDAEGQSQTDDGVAENGTSGEVGDDGSVGEGETVYDIEAWFPESEAEELCMRFSSIISGYVLTNAEAKFEDNLIYSVQFMSLGCNFQGPDYTPDVEGGEGYSFIYLGAFRSLGELMQFSEETIAWCEASENCEVGERGSGAEVTDWQCFNPEPQDVQPCMDVEMITLKDANENPVYTWGLIFEVVKDNVWISHYNRFSSEEVARDVAARVYEEAIEIIEEKQTLTLDEVLDEE